MKGLGSGMVFGLLLVAPVLYGAASAPAQTPETKPAATEATPVAAQDKPADATAFDVSDCQTCHEKAVDHMTKTPHARIEGGCAACHGDVAAHLKSETEKGEVGPVVSLLKMKPREVNATCQGCHEKSHHATWAGSMHERRGLACTTCHSAHDFKSAKSQLIYCEVYVL